MVAALARNWPGRPALLWFVVVFAAAHAVGAVTTSFAVLFATRVVAASANAGFLAVAVTAAARLVPPDRKGRALAVLLSGTTVATIAGVPGGSVLGSAFGWRAAFWAVAVLCLPAAFGILKGVPAGHGGAGATGRQALRAELAQLARPRLVLVMLLGALVNAATFGSLTFLAPVVTDGAGLGESWIPVALVLFGAGSFVGVTVAGRLSDRSPGPVVAWAGPLLLVGWPAAAVLAHEPIALLTLVFVQGALSFALGGTLITRVLYEAAGAPRWPVRTRRRRSTWAPWSVPSWVRPRSAPEPGLSGRSGRADPSSRSRCSSRSPSSPSSQPAGAPRCGGDVRQRGLGRPGTPLCERARAG